MSIQRQSKKEKGSETLVPPQPKWNVRAERDDSPDHTAIKIAPTARSDVGSQYLLQLSTSFPEGLALSGDRRGSSIPLPDQRMVSR